MLHQFILLKLQHLLETQQSSQRSFPGNPAGLSSTEKWNLPELSSHIPGILPLSARVDRDLWKDQGLEDQPGVAARPGHHAGAGLLLEEGQGAEAGAGEPGQRDVAINNIDVLEEPDIQELLPPVQEGRRMDHPSPEHRDGVVAANPPDPDISVLCTIEGPVSCLSTEEEIKNYEPIIIDRVDDSKKAVANELARQAVVAPPGPTQRTHSSSKDFGELFDTSEILNDEEEPGTAAVVVTADSIKSTLRES